MVDVSEAADYKDVSVAVHSNNMLNLDVSASAGSSKDSGFVHSSGFQPVAHSSTCVYGRTACLCC